MKLDDLKPAPYNPRRIDEAALEGLTVSIAEFGDISGIVWNQRSGHLVCGHQRLEALKKEHGDKLEVVGGKGGWAIALPGGERFPIRVVDWDEAHEKAANVTANNPHIAGTFTDSLDDLLGDIDGTLHELMGPLRLDDLFAPQDLDVIEDEVPEPPDMAVTQPGDLWVLGNHRLLCGDSAKAEDVDRLLDGATIDLINMDPPYGVRVEPRSNNAIASGTTSFARREDLQCERSSSERGKRDRERLQKKMHHQSFDVARQGAKHATHKKMRAKDRPLTNDFVTDEAFDEMLSAWFSNASRVLKPGGSFFVWGGYKNLGDYPAPLKQAGLYFSQGIVWDKQHPVLTRKDFMGASEICFYGWKLGEGHNFYGPNNATDLWHVKKVNPQSMVHLTEKPVELAARAMLYSSLPGQHVLDLFGGSGSTLIAAEQTKRRAFLMELDALYCDIIIQRWETFTGRKATRTSGSSEGLPKAQGKAPRSSRASSRKLQEAPAEA